MTYDLAVWEGERPDDVDAGTAFQRLYQQNLDSDIEIPPTPAIREYVEALLERWIDMTEDVDDVSPWSDGPLINNAAGPIIYFAMRPSMADEVSAAAAVWLPTVDSYACDPQWDCLRPAASEG